LGKPRPISDPDGKPLNVPSVEKFEARRARLEQNTKERIIAGAPKPIPCWRTHVSLMVNSNKRDIWNLLEQWEKKEMWHPSFVTESAADMPPTNWLHDKHRVVKNIETGEV
jgi:hypothetical protein